MGGRAVSDALRSRGPVPGTVEIESEHEISTSAAVPGTAMRYPNARVATCSRQRPGQGQQPVSGADGSIGDERPQSGAIPAADHCHCP